MNNPWELIVIQPMVNVLLVLSHYLFSSPGLAVIVLTIVVNIVILPLTLKQTRSSKAMQEMQPKLVELQKKYAKDKQKLAQEQMRLYREAGMSPAGCILPMLVQMPIWIALYQAIVRVLAASPEDFLSLSRFLYSWPVNFQSLPLQNRFLWFNLNSPDTLLILPVLVGATMWVQQKMSTPNYTDPKQQSQNQITLWMMPLMFGFFTLNFPSGLALFWVISSIVRIAIQYFVTGWGGLLPEKRALSQATVKKSE